MSILSMLFGRAPESDKVTVLNKVDFGQAIKKGKVQLVDVRTAKEFKAGHIKGAKNFDFFSSGQFKSGMESLDKNKTVYLYCQSGNRSQKAANKLVDAGFEEIVDLAGGYGAWLR